MYMHACAYTTAAVEGGRLVAITDRRVCTENRTHQEVLVGVGVASVEDREL